MNNHHQLVQVMKGGHWWDDLRFSAGMTNTGGANAPNISTVDGGLLFASNQTEEVFYQAQLPHKWREGSTIDPHVHWSKTTSAAGGVVWKIDYEWKNIGETYTGALGTTLELATVVVADSDTAHKHAYHSAEIAGTGFTLSSIILIRLYRDHDDGSDTYAADAKLYEFDIHYEIDSLGSWTEGLKWG